MVDVEVHDGEIEFIVRGWHRFWALRRRVVVPQAAVVAVRRDPQYARRPNGWRLLGTYLPGAIAAGHYLGRRGREFWDVSRPENALVIELQGHRFARLVVEVEAPEAVLRRLERAAA